MDPNSKINSLQKLLEPINDITCKTERLSLSIRTLIELVKSKS